MEYKRYIICTDTHGCIDEFKELISMIGPTDQDLIISLGDNVDRGPSSAECIDYCIKIGARLCKANHENKLIRWKDKEELVKMGVIKNNDVQLRNIHRRSIEDIDNHPNSKELWDYITNRSEDMICFTVKNKRYVCVHAGLHPKEGLRTPPDVLMRIRKLDNVSLKSLNFGTSAFEAGSFWAELWNGPERVIFGHNVFSEATNFKHAIGIDTGCAYGNKLTAMVIDSDGVEEIISVKAKKTYYKKGTK